MQYRLHVENRPDWENPYFYLLLIADIQLGQGHVDEAIASVELAEQNKVDRFLISDRYRAAASWYERQGRLPEAAAVLSRYRDRDPELFDSMLDRIGKVIIAKEERGEAFPTSAPTPAPSASASPSPTLSLDSRPPVALPGIDTK
jgi:hypothetical protein